jgi:hypothetical protein
LAEREESQLEIELSELANAKVLYYSETTKLICK